MEIDLVPQSPHAQTVTFSFLERPIVDFEITPLGVNIMEVPYLASLIQQQVVQGINEQILDPAKVSGGRKSCYVSLAYPR